jgi:hypothetical protein
MLEGMGSCGLPGPEGAVGSCLLGVNSSSISGVTLA